MSCHPKCLIEDDGAKAGGDPDDDTEHKPLATVGRRPQPTGGPCPQQPQRRSPPNRQGEDATAHYRSHPVVQSCSGTSPPAEVNRPSACTRTACSSAGISFMMLAISWRRRSVTASTRDRPLAVSATTKQTPIVSLSSPSDQALSHQPVAHPGCSRWGDPHSVGETRKVLWPTRGEHDKRPILGESDLLAHVREKSGLLPPPRLGSPTAQHRLRNRAQQMERRLVGFSYTNHCVY